MFSSAIEATKHGAYDYLLKPFEMEELIELVARACASSRFMSEPVEMGEPVSAHDAIIGNGRLMQDFRRVGHASLTLRLWGHRFRAPSLPRSAGAPPR